MSCIKALSSPISTIEDIYSYLEVLDTQDQETTQQRSDIKTILFNRLWLTLNVSAKYKTNTPFVQDGIWILTLHTGQQIFVYSWKYNTIISRYFPTENNKYTKCDYGCILKKIEEATIAIDIKSNMDKLEILIQFVIEELEGGTII